MILCMESEFDPLRLHVTNIIWRRKYSFSRCTDPGYLLQQMITQCFDFRRCEIDLNMMNKVCQRYISQFLVFRQGLAGFIRKYSEGIIQEVDPDHTAIDCPSNQIDASG